MDGSLYCLVINDGAVQLVRSDDEFQSFTMRKIQNATSITRYFGSRVNGQYRIFSYSGSAPRGYLVGAPFYAGVISYADFEGQSVAEALKDLSILVNAVFWVDDDGQGHFVARDLFDPGQVFEVEGRVMEEEEAAIWDETVSYVEVEGGGVTAVSGLKDFSSSGLSLNSPFVPNEAFAQALADQYADYYARRRAHVEQELIDPDGHIYRPLDRVMHGGRRFLVYESDHDLADDQVRVQLLEDV